MAIEFIRDSIFPECGVVILSPAEPRVLPFSFLLFFFHSRTQSLIQTHIGIQICDEQQKKTSLDALFPYANSMHIRLHRFILYMKTTRNAVPLTKICNLSLCTRLFWSLCSAHRYKHTKCRKTADVREAKGWEATVSLCNVHQIQYIVYAYTGSIGKHRMNARACTWYSFAHLFIHTHYIRDMLFHSSFPPPLSLCLPFPFSQPFCLPLFINIDIWWHYNSILITYPQFTSSIYFHSISLV